MICIPSQNRSFSMEQSECELYIRFFGQIDYLGSQFYQIYIGFSMLEPTMEPSELSFPQAFSEEMEWIISNGHLHEQLFRALIQEIHHLADGQISQQLESQLVDRIQGFAHKLSVTIKEIVHSCTLELHDHRLKIKELQQEIQQKEESITGLNEAIEALNTKVHNWQNQYENLKSQSSQMQEKYEQRLREARREKKQIKQTFRLVQQETEIERALLENLQIEKEEIHGLVISEQREKQVLKSELEQIKQKFLQSSRKLEASASKLTWEEKRIQKLEETLAQRDTLILKLTQQIQAFNQLPENGGSEDGKPESVVATKSFLEEHHQPQQPKRHVSFVESFKLSDEIMNIRQDFEHLSVLSLKKSNQDSCNLNRSISEAEAEPQQDIPTTFTEVQRPRINVPDFYLAHFLLVKSASTQTSQAIKIKLNSQKYLGVDLSKHYSDVIRNCIPFHMWDEWIKQKLMDSASTA